MSNPFNGMTREQILRQQMAQPRPQPQIDISTFKTLKCDCGGLEMESVSSIVIKYDPLMPQQYAQLQASRPRCISCKKYPVFNGKEWTFVADPPPLGVE